jgi:DHA2 family multidrug resistance protein
MIPLFAVTMAEGRESGAASSLFNMMRNIGGSIGIAGLSTLLSVRERFHSERIGESVTIYSAAVRNACSSRQLTSRLRAAIRLQPRCARSMRVGGTVRRQAFLLAYGDCFLALGCVLLASAIALFFIKK